MNVAVKKKTDHSPTININRFAHHQIGWQRYTLLCIAVAAQIATILITWQLWEVRVEPPNIPVLKITPISFGIFMLVSLIGVLIDPLRGFVLHVGLMVVACLLDQYRMQPQFLANILLMLATLGRRGQLVCYWFLAAMWFWAGLHKLISEHWYAHASFWIFSRADIPREVALVWLKPFALTVAISEIALGLAALIRPRVAAFGCVLLHVGIVVLLLKIDWNASVIPWNLATAVVGFWVLNSKTKSKARNSESSTEKPRVESNYVLTQSVAAIAFFLLPIGFYFGVYDHGYANVLYSDSLPRARMTSKEILRTFRGWDVVNVPFPSERRTLRQFFERLGEPGDKLHLIDPRTRLPDQHFVLSNDGQAIEISEDDFFSSSPDVVAGIGMDDRYSSFQLRRWGVITQRYYQDNDTDVRNVVSYGYTFSPEHYQPERLQYLAGLPNLVELQLKGCAVEDDDLKYISGLKRLTGLGLSGTGITDAGLQHLTKIPLLEIVESDNSRISPAGLKSLKEQLDSLR